MAEIIGTEYVIVDYINFRMTDHGAEWDEIVVGGPFVNRRDAERAVRGRSSMIDVKERPKYAPRNDGAWQ